MATVVGKTSTKIDQLIGTLVQEQILRGEVTPEGQLILYTRNGTGILAGQVNGKRGAPGVVQVKHHNNPDVPRPDSPVVHWIGEATPNEALSTDWRTPANIP